MRRRELVASVATASIVTLGGCGAIRSETTISDPTIYAESHRDRTLIFEDDGRNVASMGFSGGVDESVAVVTPNLSHAAGTLIESIRLRVWMPSTGTGVPADVALDVPVEGDSSPPPTVTLSTSHRQQGSIISIDDFDDLADETISILKLLIRPQVDGATTVAFEPTIELTSSGLLGSDYTLQGALELEFPEFTA